MRKGEVQRGSKLALVTGASTGIGRQYAEQLADLGYNLIIVSRSEEKLNEVAHEIEEKHGVKVVVKAMDLATTDAADTLFNWCKAEGYIVDVLINNAGMFSCVGCGRCVDKCPSHLNIVKVIKAFGKEEN